MNLRNQTEQALTLVSRTPHTLTAGAVGQDYVTCQLAALDSLACAFSQLELATNALASSSTEDLKAVSEELSRRLTYLLEPISPIEIDSDGCVVQMRSNPPQKDDDGTSYYELLVRKSGLSLRRWRREKAGGERDRLEAQVTREVLLRLVGDFQAVVKA